MWSHRPEKPETWGPH